MTKPYSVVEGAVRLALKVAPRAARNELDGMVQDVEGRPLLKLRLKAPPVDGAANAALIAFLAEELGLRKADIIIRSGETGSTKILHLSGEPQMILQKLDAWLARNKD